MLADRIEAKEDAPDTGTDAADSLMVGWMRLLLAASVVLTIVVDSPGLGDTNSFAWIVSTGYLIHSAALYALAQLDRPLPRSRLVHWFDVGWYALIVSCTGGIDSIFFLFFFFAILTASFRYGFEEGARITIASAVLFIVCSLLIDFDRDFPRLLMRTAFLLALGYMSAHWGELKMASKRRLGLLRDVSKLSNPRFGVDHTITSVLEKIRDFFQGSACILVVHDREGGAYSLRTVREVAPARTIGAECIREQAARPLLAFPQNEIILYARPYRKWPFLDTGSMRLDANGQRLGVPDAQAGLHLADLLEADSYLSAPLSLRQRKGRIYLISRGRRFARADALFLGQIVAQAFPVIDNIELLDRIASEAAAQERNKIAWDLHDTTIQPYIGLKLGLSALRNKASADNPLVEDLDRLMEMSAQAASDLRRFAGSFRGKGGTGEQGEPILVSVLRSKVEQVRRFYGIDIEVATEGPVGVSDRLAAEALQLVSEGLSNICKHTAAQKGCVRIMCEQGWLKIRIENEGSGKCAMPFTPCSITERAAALGGKTFVRLEPDGGAAIDIDIPI